MSKEAVLTAVQAMPDEIELNALLERLVFMAKVEEGMRQSETNQTVAHEDVKRMVESWSK